MQFLHYLTYGYLLDGVAVTLEVTGGAFAVGLIAGVLLAAVQLARVPVITALVRGFVLLTRGTPVLLQLLFVYDVLPTIGISLPALTTAVLVLGLNTATFFSEVMRGSVLSLERGQTVAAQSLGMSPWTISRHVVLPQAIRVALPQLANQTVVLILTSSLASTISVSDLTLRSQTISSSNFQIIPVYLASGVMYLVLTSVVSGAQILLERSLDLDRPSPARAGRLGMLRQGLTGADVLRRTLAQLTGVGSKGVGLNSTTVDPAGEGPGPSIEGTDGAFSIAESQLERALAAQLGATRARARGPMLSLVNLQKRYGDHWALKGVDLEVQPGEVVVIMGASGCGKSTLLRCVAQLEPLEGGDVLIAGTRLGRDNLGLPVKGQKLARARAAARVAMVFQSFELFKHMTALKNVTIALETVYGQDSAEAAERARQLLQTVGLGTHADKLPRHLSGGQQQRVAIARALAISPWVMLLDEPTSALDPEMVHEVLSVLRALAGAGMTMLVVTHEVKFAMEIADRLVYMADGRIVESGPPGEVLSSPGREATRSFLRLLEV